MSQTEATHLRIKCPGTCSQEARKRLNGQAIGRCSDKTVGLAVRGAIPRAVPTKSSLGQGWAAAILLTAVLGLDGCTALRRFLVPPADPSEGVRLKHDAERETLSADAVLIVGHVPGYPDGTAVALHRGEVIAVGAPEDVTPLHSAQTLIVRARGGWLSTGLIDAHVHLDGSGKLLDAADLSKVEDAADLSRAVATARSSMTSWLWGYGLSQEAWEHMATAEVDAALDELPAWLSRADGHGALITSSLATVLPMDLAAEARAAGYRLQGPLAQRAWRALPAWPVTRMRSLVRNTLERMQQRGVTEIHAMGESMALVEVLYRLEAAGQLPVRVRVYLDAERHEGQAFLAGKLERSPSQLVYIAGVKIWLDGTLGARTAALSAPYADRAEAKGDLLYTDAEVASFLGRADQRGIQLAVHAIGDEAMAQILRVMQAAARPPAALAVRIEHAQVVSPEQLQILKQVRAECSVQPRHAEQDAEFAVARLGDKRREWAYRSLGLAPWCTVRAGSDVPLIPSDPLADWRLMSQTALPGLSAVQTAELAWQAISSSGTGAATRPLRVGDAVDLVIWSADPRDPTSKAVPMWSVVRGLARQTVAE